MLSVHLKTCKTKFPQPYGLQQQQARRMPVLTSDHLAVKLRQNWMAKYPLDTCSNGGTNLDDSLTSLNWLQNLNILKTTSATPPTSPVPPFENFKRFKVNPNSVLNVACGPSPAKLCEMRFPPLDTPPLTPTTLGGDSVDKTNPYVKPPYSYATMICMAMNETKKSKITLSAIYNWITDNFMYYSLADPSWQNSIRHNLSLNKCFQKVPRREDEPGKGGFWRINPEYHDMIENGVFKTRRNSRDGQTSGTCSNAGSPQTLNNKTIKREPVDDGYPDSFNQPTKIRKLENGKSVIQFGAQDEEDSLKGDFNWTSLLNQDIEVAGIKIKSEYIIDTPTEDAASQIMAMSPPRSDSNSNSDFGIDGILGDTNLSEEAIYFTTQDNLDLTVVGSGIRAPEWWSESFNFSENSLLQNIENMQDSRTCLNTQMSPAMTNQPLSNKAIMWFSHSLAHQSSMNDTDDHRPWCDRSDFDADTECYVDNLFDIENIPSPALSPFIQTRKSCNKLRFL